MGEKENKELAERFNEEVFNKHSIEAVDEMLHEDFRERMALPPGMGDDKKSTMVFFEQWLAAIPDMKGKIEELIASGDKVCIRSTFSGTQTGELMGMPATGKPFSIGSMDILRVQDGKCIEHWGVQDTAGMMMQVGLMPTPEGEG